MLQFQKENLHFYKPFDCDESFQGFEESGEVTFRIYKIQIIECTRRN